MRSRSHRSGTPPGRAAIDVGKHVWSEKPIGVDRTEAAGLLTAAAAAGLRVGVAPDTILGPAMQTAVRALRRGDIGVPLSAQTAMQYVGPDMFHPAPEFLFTTGAGPVVDMGPYYIAALVSLFGPVARVGALGLRGQDTRQVKVGDRAGSSFPVSVPTHVQTIAQFEKGQTSQSVFSFDSPITRMGVLEVIGTEGTLVIPDPNRFTGEVRIARAATNYEGIDEPIWSRCDAVGIESGRGLDLIRALGTEGLSYDRIAARVGVSASTARNVLKRTGRWSR